MKFSSFAIIFCASTTLVLSGCAGLPDPTAKVRETKATAVSGKRTKISSTAHIKADCEFAGYPYTAAIKQPAHGKIEVVHEEVRVHYPKDGPGYVCSGKPVQGNAVYYTPDPGYTGTDQFTIRLSALRVARVDDDNVTVTVVK
jgi:hypothetical protein